MEVERGMLCRGAVGAAGRPCQEVIQARIDRGIQHGGPQPKGIQRKGAKTQRRNAACRNQSSITTEFRSELKIGN